MEEGEFEDACGAGADDPGERILLADRLGAACGRLDHGHAARVGDGKGPLENQNFKIFPRR